LPNITPIFSRIWLIKIRQVFDFDGERLAGEGRQLYTIDVTGTKGTMHMQGWDWGPGGVDVASQGNAVLETFCKEPGKYNWVGGATYVAESLLTGKPKTAGKTTLTMDLVRALVTGDSFLGEPVQKNAVIYLSEPTLVVADVNRVTAEETAAALRLHGDGPSWLHTGDLGHMDEEGYLFIVDRKKDLIKIGGLQVWPREIEEVVATHPAVAEVGVAGVPDAAKGELVKAWVVVREGMSLSEGELRAFCKERLAPFKAPSQVEFRKELPKSLVGKVLRRALRESVAQKDAAGGSNASS
jgi:acyl-CoA synthetase (AMP-forming)/AMP-acid ligase II